MDIECNTVTETYVFGKWWGKIVTEKGKKKVGKKKRKKERKKKRRKGRKEAQKA